MKDILTVDDLESMVAEAQLSYREGDYFSAANGYLVAARGYALANDQLTAAEMANNCSVAYLQAGEPQLALEVVEGKEEVYQQAGDRRRLAMTIGNRGAAYDALDRVEEALEDYHFSAKLFNEIGEHEFYTKTMQAISALQLRKGRSMEAVASMQAGINKIERPNVKQRLLKRLLDLPFRLLNR